MKQLAVLLLILETLLVACGGAQTLSIEAAKTPQVRDVSSPEPTNVFILTPVLIHTYFPSLVPLPTLEPTSTSVHISTPAETQSETPTPRPSLVPTATPVSRQTLCEEPLNPPNGWVPCSEYELSPDGTRALFYWGAYWCGRGSAVVDLRTDEVQILVGEGRGGRAEFISENEILYLTDSCEGSTPYVKNLVSGEVVQLGAHVNHEGWYWNPQKTVVVGESDGSYCGWETSLYGYNLTQHRKLSISRDLTSDSRAIWTPSGTHLLFQRRALTSTGWITHSTRTMFQEIFILDIDSGESSPLLSDPAYDHWLCPQDCTWNGDQIEVMRTAAYTVTVPSLTCEDHSGYTVNWDCLLRGENCPGSREQFMLNWHTGELASYDK